MTVPDVGVQHAKPGELEASIAGLRRRVEILLRRRCMRELTLETEFGVRGAAQIRHDAAIHDLADHGRLGADY